jgi:hypothetical protein
MMARKDGGAAFPREDYQTDCTRGQHGMTLRDYFAAAALAECPDPITEADAPKVARLAYAIANAMLAEREKEKADG